MTPPLPGPAITDQETTLLQLIAAKASYTAIAERTGLSGLTVRGAIQSLLIKIDARTWTHAAAWATAQRIITHTNEPCAALIVAPRLPPRLLEVLRKWSGGSTDHELTDEFKIRQLTMRSYSKTILNSLGVSSQEQAGVAGVLCGLVHLNHINPTWPHIPLSAQLAGNAT